VILDSERILVSEPRSGESIQDYRLRMIEIRLESVEKCLSEFKRLRRDTATGVLVILIALAFSQPQIWAIVTVWAAKIAAIVRKVNP